LVILIFSIIIGKSIYDNSWDGQEYHQETIIQLKEGWNPYYSKLNSNVPYFYLINHYGKGAEIPQATIYAFINKIQAGKATNILLLLASYFLCAHALYGIKKLSTFNIHLVSSLFAFNPVTTNQIFTFYIDGQVGSLLCCLLIVSYMLYNSFDKYKLLLFSSIVIILLNIKFTCVPFAGVFILGLLIALYCNNKNIFRKVLIVASLSSIISIGFVGYNPYITNTINHGNPFYPLLGKNKKDIMTGNSPKGFNNKNRFENIAISIFSHPDNILEVTNRSPVMKYPFMLNKEDIFNSIGVDKRISGFGFLFEEILLLAIAIYCSILLFSWAEFGRCLTYIIGVLLFSIFIISEAWWARYVPQLWLVCLIICIAANLNKYMFIKNLGYILLILIMFNSYCIMALAFIYNVKDTVNYEYQLTQIKKLNDTIKVNFGAFNSVRMRFIEQNINYIEENISIGDNNVVFIEGSCGALVKLTDIPEDLPKPFIMKWGYKLKELHIFK
jgi:type IV secretory pathway VirB2 component (pilin)